MSFWLCLFQDQPKLLTLYVLKNSSVTNYHDVLLQHPPSFILVDLTAAVPSPQLGALSFLSLAYIFSQKISEFLCELLWKAQEIFSHPGASCNYTMGPTEITYGNCLCCEACRERSPFPQRLKLVPGQLVQSSSCPVTCLCIRQRLPAPMGVHCQLCKYSAPQKKKFFHFLGNSAKILVVWRKSRPLVTELQFI